MRPAPAFDRFKWTDAIAPWVVARLLIAVSYVAAESVAAGSTDAELHVRVNRGLAVWDGDWYRQILASGYDGIPAEARRFFPFYPIVAKGVSWLTFGNGPLALAIVANGFALVAMVLLGRLVLDVTSDSDLARRSVWWLALFPSSAVLVMSYGESLALTLSLGALLCLRKDRWGLAALLSIGASLTRPVGVLMVVPILFELWDRRDDIRGVFPLTKAAGVLASPFLGLGLYLLWVEGHFGNGMEPIEIQGDLRAGLQDPFTRLWDAIVLTVRESQLDAPNLAFALGFIVLLALMVRRLPLGWSAFALVTLVVSLSARNIDSIGRYGIMAFPFVVGLATLIDTERRTTIALALSSGGLVALTIMSLVGTYTP